MRGPRGSGQVGWICPRGRRVARSLAQTSSWAHGRALSDMSHWAARPSPAGRPLPLPSPPLRSPQHPASLPARRSD